MKKNRIKETKNVNIKVKYKVKFKTKEIKVRKD